jgi:hypothetical protein
MLNWSNESGWTLPIGKLFCTLLIAADDISHRKNAEMLNWSNESGWTLPIGKLFCTLLIALTEKC